MFSHFHKNFYILKFDVRAADAGVCVTPAAKRRRAAAADVVPA